MKSTYVANGISNLKAWALTTLLCLVAIAFVWQGAFFADTTALAAPATGLFASKDAGDQVKDKARNDAGDTKGFIRDAADAVKDTANKNADRVERATGNDGGFLERKANRDADRIEQRADRDAARTQKAVDETKNVVERAVDGIKDAFSD